MLHIAICDDDARDLSQLTALLLEYQDATNTPLQVHPFPHADLLLEEQEKGCTFDILFLDILMPGMDGIQVAKELRTFDPCTELVYTTTSPDFALDAFSVKARDYLLKPLCAARLFPLMEELQARLRWDKKLVINGKEGPRNLPLQSVEYCEARRHRVLWNLRSGEVFEAKENFHSTLEKLTPHPQFLQVHRSFVVNLNYITLFDRKNSWIELESMVRIPIPKNKYVQLEQQYIAYQEAEVPR